jgi:hypothetical protein
MLTAVFRWAEYKGITTLLYPLVEVTGWPHILSTFLQGKSPHYPLNRRLGRPQSWSGYFGEKKKYLVLDCPLHSLVTMVTMLMLQRVGICTLPPPHENVAIFTYKIRGMEKL